MRNNGRVRRKKGTHIMKKIRFLAVLAVALVVVAPLHARAGEESVLIKWKFVPGKQYVYDYEQVVVTAGTHADGKDEGSVNGAGTITIVCGDKQTTMHVQVKITGGMMNGEEAPAEMIAEMPPLDVKLRMLPDGTIGRAEHAGGGSMQLLTELLFPVPPGPLTPGKAIEQEGVTFSMGPLNLKGKGKFEYKAPVKANGMGCVLYDVSYDTAHQEGAGDDIDGSMKLKADSKVVFAPDAGYFISVKSRSEMKMTTTSPMHGDEMTITMHNTVSLRLKAVEDVPKEDQAEE